MHNPDSDDGLIRCGFDLRVTRDHDHRLRRNHIYSRLGGNSDGECCNHYGNSESGEQK